MGNGFRGLCQGLKNEQILRCSVNASNSLSFSKNKDRINDLNQISNEHNQLNKKENEPLNNLFESKMVEELNLENNYEEENKSLNSSSNKDKKNYYIEIIKEEDKIEKEEQKILKQNKSLYKIKKIKNYDISYNKKIEGESKIIEITNNSNHQKININYNPDLTIISIKNTIKKYYGYSIESQEIFLNNILLNDNDIISDLELKYNIFLIDQLTLSLKDRTIKFNYKNENFEIKISNLTTFEELKKKNI